METQLLKANKITINLGTKNSIWYRIKQLIKWIFTGTASFPFLEDENPNNEIDC